MVVLSAAVKAVSALTIMIYFDFELRRRLVQRQYVSFTYREIAGHVQGFISCSPDVPCYKCLDKTTWLAFDFTNGCAKFWGYKSNPKYKYCNVLDLYKYLLTFEDRDFELSDMEKLVDGN